MAAWTQWLSSQLDLPHISSPPAGVETVRQQVLSILDDCEGVECDRLRWRLHTAECAQDLWMLRGPIFQVVASQHCQSLATDRLNELAPAFQEILPRTMVARVRNSWA
ncbi:hypothetical protein FN976_13430 [Caenimonas sedimenti]|uniref:Uncharacterized protein n=1 Tax=Caenimonas sedimenti TaxID=2596921 RepID=A0A562ZPP9_9BURK|nr:hypothetical protein [Caenimonas sedimenti]TWO70562.1 hypothetical protein FN976_13430 [Caenimonas sedimenti]